MPLMKKKGECTFKELKNFRFVRVNEQTREILERQCEAFRKKFGREPGPDDPLFFDPRADHPRPIELSSIDFERIMLEVARAENLPAAVIAYVQQNCDKEAVFVCGRCETQLIGWALADPICPTCGHESLDARMVIAK